MKRVIFVSIVCALGTTANAADLRPSPTPTPHPIERPPPQIPTPPPAPYGGAVPTGPNSVLIYGGKGDTSGTLHVAPGDVRGTVTFPHDIGGR